jgi:hypothetical protein
MPHEIGRSTEKGVVAPKSSAASTGKGLIDFGRNVGALGFFPEA